MALSSREKGLVTLVIVGALVGSLWGCMNMFNTIQANIANKSQLEATKMQKDQDLSTKKTMYQTLEQGKNLPPSIQIRTYTPETLEKNIKEMLDNMVRLATDRSNTLISIFPTKDAEQTTTQLPPPTPPGGAPADPNAPPAVDPATGQPIAAAPPAPPPGVELKSIPYSLSFRGTFDTLTDFIDSLKQYPELVEIVSLEMSNEAGPERIQENGGMQKSHFDPAKPIKLQMNVRLLLVPQSLAGTPAPADGTTPTADGTTPPADGTTPPTADGTTPPADGTATATGETPPATN